MTTARSLCFVAVWSVVFTLACRQPSYAPVGSQRAELLYEQRSEGSAETILVFMPETTQTQQVLIGIGDEVGGQFSLLAVGISGANDDLAIKRAIGDHQPRAVILMNNPTVAAYRQYLRHPLANHDLPVIVAMSSFLDVAQLREMNAVGISYEVPLITVVTNLRRIVATPVERVGVIYRRRLAPFIESETQLAAMEHISVVSEVVSSNPNPSELKRALRLLRQKSDVLWILNDDQLLTPRLLADGWLPGLQERPWRPIIVGAGSLVSAQRSFGTFAVVPDHTALGVQAASLLFEIADNDWRIPDRPRAELPLSTRTAIDLVQATDRLSLLTDALAQVDHVVE